jgi:hypothetical protein
MHFSTMEKACGPERRITAIAPTPAADDSAAIVRVDSIIAPYIPEAFLLEVALCEEFSMAETLISLACFGLRVYCGFGCCPYFLRVRWFFSAFA